MPSSAIPHAYRAFAPLKIEHQAHLCPSSLLSEYKLKIQCDFLFLTLSNVQLTVKVQENRCVVPGNVPKKKDAKSHLEMNGFSFLLLLFLSRRIISGCGAPIYAKKKKK